ncbi:hypothetical protein [Enterococcus cecorum]|nr:hypothetical protein CIRMBP1257_00969 [Enterococcus cecorum]
MRNNKSTGTEKKKNTKRILELNFKLLKKQLEQHKEIYMKLKDK